MIGPSHPDDVGGEKARDKFAIKAPIQIRSRRRYRLFFLGMAMFAVAILLFAFVPEFWKFAAGTFPIPWVLHVHAAIMFSWAGVFALQAYLGASGRASMHRRIGPYAIAIGWLAWASMIFVEFRGMVVHPLPEDVSDFDWSLPGPFVYLTFGVFLAWGVHERSRPQWHKRLMTFALFVSIEAAIQRYGWIPRNYGFGGYALALNVFLLLPLMAYDLRSLKWRLHPATVSGALLLFTSEAVLFALWGSMTWRQFASAVAHGLYG